MGCYLKRGIATMPASTTELPPQYHFWQLALSLWLPPIIQSSVIFHHGCWKAPFQHPVSTLRGSHFHRTLDKQLDPQWTLIQWFTMPPQMHLCSELLAISGCSPYLQTIPCSHFSRQRPFIKSTCNTIGLDCPVYVKNYCNHAPLVPSQPVCHKPMDFSSNFQFLRSLEFHIHGFHREAPSIFWLHLGLKFIVDHLSKHHFFMRLMIHYAPQLDTLHSTCLSKHGVPSHVTSDAIWNSYPTFLSLRLHWTEASLHSGISSWRWWTNHEPNQTLETVPLIYCNYQQTNWSEGLPLLSSLITYSECHYWALPNGPLWCRHSSASMWAIYTQSSLNGKPAQSLHWLCNIMRLVIHTRRTRKLRSVHNLFGWTNF